jgi:Fic family protein
MVYQPPFTLNGRILSLVAEIAQIVGRLSAQPDHAHALRLLRINRIRTVQGSLAIEGNTLSEEQITAILDGKRIIAPPKDVQEARNALAVYEQLEAWQSASEQHLLDAHALLMKGLIDDAGHYRQGGVGVMKGDQVVHMAPPANRVSKLVTYCTGWK